jgi:hypothetical protein
VALADPNAVRQKALSLLSHLDELDEPEALMMPILLDAVTIVETYRRARHQVSYLPELTKSVDALLRELEIIKRVNDWAREELPSAEGREP